MGKNVVVIGTQWGDEGKGKIVDLLTHDAQVVVRYQGGHNAGHTLKIKGEKTVLRLNSFRDVTPACAVLYWQWRRSLPKALLDEIKELEKKGVNVRNRLHISLACPLILPCHVALDKARENHKGGVAIGTTGRGIGPAYEDKVARRALKVSDLFHPQRFKTKLTELLQYHNFVLKNYYQPA